MDETTDIPMQKQCALSVIFYDKLSEKICTNFLDLVEPESGNAVDLFNSFKNAVLTKNIPLSNLIGFSSDTTNVMVGEFRSVFALLKE